jgi:ankyrin repeat protein
MTLAFVPEVGINPKDILGRTPLSWASSDDHLIAVEWLLNRDADTSIPDLDGWTPLHFAAANGRVKSIERLLVGNANREARSRSGETPLETARRLRQHEAALMLQVDLGQ